MGKLSGSTSSLFKRADALFRLLTYSTVRKRYERLHGDINHRNGSYERNFTLKGIGEVDLQVPTQV